MHTHTHRGGERAARGRREGERVIACDSGRENRVKWKCSIFFAGALFEMPISLFHVISFWAHQRKRMEHNYHYDESLRGVCGARCKSVSGWCKRLFTVITNVIDCHLPFSNSLKVKYLCRYWRRQWTERRRRQPHIRPIMKVSHALRTSIKHI